MVHVLEEILEEILEKFREGNPGGKKASLPFPENDRERQTA